MIELYKVQVAYLGDLDFDKKLMLEKIHEWLKNQNNSSSNVTLATYSSGTNYQN